MASPPFSTPRVTEGPAQARRALARAAERVWTRASGDGLMAPYVERIAVPVAPADPKAWLAAQADARQVYWCGRSQAESRAGVGIADACTGTEETSARELAACRALQEGVRPLLEASDPAVRYYGGLSFDPRQPLPDAWRAFGTFRFVLPRFEFVAEGDTAHLVCNLVLPYDLPERDAIFRAIEALQPPTAWRPERHALPAPVSRRDVPDRAGWHRNIAWALRAFDEGVAEKIVLARRATFGFDTAVEPLILLQQLEAATPECFHFLFQYEAGTAFVGASPERLFRREGRSIWSEAVAGTRPRGTSADDDERLRAELLGSEKDQREHAYVRHSIVEALGRLSTQLDVDDAASVMRLARGRHLVTRVQGTLRPDVTDFDVLTRLHPTPAVGGYPADVAKQAIADLEPFGRGWYAGPVGWVGRDEAEFAVAIRSGLVQGPALALYSGAGIVAGSCPDDEWDEIETKIGDFINVLGLDARLRRAQ